MTDNPTIYDIATRAGVGIATVSRVLNGSARVRPETRAAVQQAMADLGFRPNRAARRLAVGGANRPRIAALLPLFSGSFYFTVSRPMAQDLLRDGLDLVLFDVADREAKNRLLDRIISERGCEGVVLCSMGIGPDRQDQLRSLGIPFICVDYPLPGVPSITVDNVLGGTLGARHLVDTGARRIALINGPATAHAFRDREQGFRQVLGSQARVAVAATLSREAGSQACGQLLDEDPAIDGLVCANDLLAIGALETLRQRGRKIPDDVQVIGFDDQPLMDVLGLTTIRQPMATFGEWGAKSIASLVLNPGPPVPPVELPLTLIHRATTWPVTGQNAADPAPATRPRAG